MNEAAEGAATKQAMTTKQDDAPLVNCVMLVTWPKRRAMIHEALVSFVHHRTTRGAASLPSRL